MGMFRWPAYKEQRASINRLIHIIRRSVHVYRQRRLEAGFFYLRKCLHSPYGFRLHSHLLRMPLKEALKRRRQEMKKRRDIRQEIMEKRGQIVASRAHLLTQETITTMLTKVCTTRMLSSTVASIFFGCIIILFP